MNDENPTPTKGVNVADSSPYGHDYPVLDALADWVQATDPYTAPMDITDEVRLNLANTTRLLNAALVDLVPYPHMVADTPEFHQAQTNWELCYKTRVSIRELSAQFLTEEYTDSNTDEPCDVEWNVTGLVMLVHPEYKRSDEIRPGYVGYLIDEGPEEDQE